MITNDHLLAGPYALDAIDGDELIAFEDHLDDCATCVLEVAEFRETAALLAQGAAQPVPTGLLGRVMAEVRTTAQLPPLVADAGSSDDTSVHEPAPDVEPAVDDADDGGHNVVPFRRRLRPRWLISVAAALVVLLGAVGAITVVTRNQQSPYELAVEAPGRTSTLAGDGGTTADLKRVDGSTDAALTANLPALPSDKTYQLWFIDGGGPHSATTFTPDDQGNVRVSFSQPVEDPAAFGITVEPAGGSVAPTPPILLQGAAT